MALAAPGEIIQDTVGPLEHGIHGLLAKQLSSNLHALRNVLSSQGGPNQ